ncbi:MAG: hypothetical protein M3Q97_05090 [Bacteroidota bacterium]|nr:hypothetical protein [Bacteroidota bacterium]
METYTSARVNKSNSQIDNEIEDDSVKSQAFQIIEETMAQIREIIRKAESVFNDVKDLLAMLSDLWNELRDLFRSRRQEADFDDELAAA